jgi:LysM repeat protein
VSRKQAVQIILVNAIISALITAGAIWFFVLPALEREGRGSGDLQRAGSTVASPVAGATEGLTLSTPTPIVHVVASGDTISGLAFKYDVPAEEIIAANNLENPNMLQVGAELIIPVGGVPDVTATFTPVPTPTDTPIPFEPPSADMTATAAALAGIPTTPLLTPLPSTGTLQIEITEAIKPGVVEQEAVVLTNVGARLAEMQGWSLRDAEGNTYTFPNFRLWPGGNVTVHSGVGQDGSPPSNLYWGRTEAAWSTGEMVTLLDAEGQTMASHIVGR